MSSPVGPQQIATGSVPAAYLESLRLSLRDSESVRPGDSAAAKECPHRGTQSMKLPYRSGGMYVTGMCLCHRIGHMLYVSVPRSDAGRQCQTPPARPRNVATVTVSRR